MKPKPIIYIRTDIHRINKTVDDVYALMCMCVRERQAERQREEKYCSVIAPMTGNIIAVYKNPRVTNNVIIKVHRGNSVRGENRRKTKNNLSLVYQMTPQYLQKSSSHSVHFFVMLIGPT